MKVRYFSVSYYGGNRIDLTVGDISFSYNGFPSRDFIKTEVLKFNPNMKEMGIINIYEFKSNAEFKAFRKEK